MNFSYLPDKKTKTLMREMDFFYKIETTPDKGGKMILHIEFQTDKDSEMVYRIAEYHGFALRIHQLPVKHVVIHLGTNKVDMVSQLKPSEVFTGFELINLWELDLNQCLLSQVPEVITLAILSNYPKKQIEPVLRSIIKRLQEVAPKTRDFRLYVTQLGLLSRLRDGENIITKILKEMPIYYDVENDLLYKEGFEKAKMEAQEELDAERKRLEAEKEVEVKRLEAEKKAEVKRLEVEKKAEVKRLEVEKLETIKALTASKNFDVAEVARIFKVSEEFVLQIINQRK